MAVYGRRQPHAPIILRGGPPPSVARIVVPNGGRTSQAASLFAHRPLFRPIFRTVGKPQAVGRITTPRGQGPALAAALRGRQPKEFRPFIGVPERYPPPVVVPPIAKPPVIWGRRAAQAAAIAGRQYRTRTGIHTPLIPRIVFRPFLMRVPDPTDTRRMAGFTERVSSMVNSLIAQDILKQTGVSAWTINTTNASGGLTGTFSSGPFP